MSESRPVVLIAYPKEWACFSKLSRKLNTLLAKLSTFEVMAFDDEQGLLARFLADDARSPSMLWWSEHGMMPDYAVIFDDGVSFVALKSQLGLAQVNLRLIPVLVTRLVNIDKQVPYDVYIGRGSGFGNPYAIGIEGDDRDEVIRKFQYDFDRDYLKKAFKQRLLAVQGKTLGCHCKPLACHGDVLVNFLNAHDDGR